MSSGSSEARIYEVVIKKSARKELARCERHVQVRINEAIERLKTNPMPRGVRKLSGSDGIWRIRVDNYRVLYKFIDGQLVICVIKIGHRRDVYR